MTKRMTKQGKQGTLNINTLTQIIRKTEDTTRHQKRKEKGKQRRQGGKAILPVTLFVVGGVAVALLCDVVVFKNGMRYY